MQTKIKSITILRLQDYQIALLNWSVGRKKNQKTHKQKGKEFGETETFLVFFLTQSIQVSQMSLL